uniref:Uncharacterized protein n=1 Tax=viral metagenome TaxID=1070528 RepID=A0A6C0LLB8_9ZZZZ
MLRKYKKQKQGNTRQYKAIQGKSRQIKANQGKSRQIKANQGKSRQIKANQGKSRQYKAIQGNTRQSKRGDILHVIMLFSNHPISFYIEAKILEQMYPITLFFLFYKV